MASLKIFTSFLLASYPLLASAQCGGYDWYPDAAHNPSYCGVNYDDGTYLESGLIPVGSDCPGTFGLTYFATAYYTDINHVVRTASNVNTVTTVNPSTTVTFFYNVPYSSILDGSPVSIDYVFNDRARTVTGLPQFTIYNSADYIKYTDTTSTVSTSVEVSTVSTSTIPSTTTVTATNTALATVTSATATSTAATQTVTHTITITPRPRTIRKERIIIRKTTAPCIPSRYRRRNVDAAKQLNRRIPITTPVSHSYAFATCAGSPPTTTTVTTSTILTTVTSTNTFTNTVFTTVLAGTSTSTVTQTDTVSATATVTITPAPVTKTAHTVAKRQTVTSTHTITIWDIVYKKKRLCTPPPPPPYHGPHPTCIKPKYFGHH
ncbi:hypothetical protein TWF694_008085 [Orbilia ellipsospora]|uniref:Uncharacterized protein n=1 Tax=Orbilia ellipsospora TaxID=2528407 RepID=A0AAV9XFP4_9PEZI